MTHSTLRTPLLALTLSWLLCGCSSVVQYVPWQQAKTEPIAVKEEAKKPKIVVDKTRYSFEDKLLLIETRGLLERLEILNEVQLTPKNTNRVRTHKHELKRQLAEKQVPLSSCSQRHKNRRLNLAVACARLAQKIGPSATSNATLQDIQQRIAKRKERKQITQTANIKRKRDSLMALAKKQIRQPNHIATIKTLNQLLATAPNDREAKRLLRDLKAIQQKHVSELISMGDRLYRNENIEQALSVWRAAKNLSNNNKELLAKIDRAEKVLGSVNKIKALPENKQPQW